MEFLWRMLRRSRLSQPVGSLTQRPPDPVRALALCTQSEEEAFTDDLIGQCWEQGCWVPDRVADYALDGASQRALFVEAENRQPILHREAVFATRQEVPETLAQDATEPDDAIWVIVSQRCDLIKGFRDEPTVALVRATKWKTVEARQHTRRSPIYYLVRTRGENAWVADFRETITIPKLILRSFPARQCLPDDANERRQFALAFAQRSWRRPVPRELIEKVQKPLENRYKSGTWRNFFASIAEFLIDQDPNTGRAALYAVIGDDVSSELDLQRFFDEQLLTLLDPDEAGWLDHERSRVLPADQYTVPMLLRT